MSKSSKMIAFINWRMRVTVQDARMFVGTLLAFDRHMNLVLGDCEEFRRLKSNRKSQNKMMEVREEKRSLGLVLLRGENIVSMQIESPPQKNNEAGSMRGVQAQGGGAVNGAGRVPPAGLGGFANPSGMMAAHAPPVTGAGYGMPPPPMGMPPPGMMGMGMPPGMGRGRGMPPPPPQ